MGIESGFFRVTCSVQTISACDPRCQNRLADPDASMLEEEWTSQATHARHRASDANKAPWPRSRCPSSGRGSGSTRWLDEEARCAGSGVIEAARRARRLR